MNDMIDNVRIDLYNNDYEMGFKNKNNSQIAHDKILKCQYYT